MWRTWNLLAQTCWGNDRHSWSPFGNFSHRETSSGCSDKRGGADRNVIKKLQEMGHPEHVIQVIEQRRNAYTHDPLMVLKLIDVVQDIQRRWACTKYMISFCILYYYKIAISLCENWNAVLFQNIFLETYCDVFWDDTGKKMRDRQMFVQWVVGVFEDTVKLDYNHWRHPRNKVGTS